MNNSLNPVLEGLFSVMPLQKQQSPMATSGFVL